MFDTLKKGQIFLPLAIIVAWGIFTVFNPNMNESEMYDLIPFLLISGFFILGILGYIQDHEQKWNFFTIGASWLGGWLFVKYDVLITRGLPNFTIHNSLAFRSEWNWFTISVILMLFLLIVPQALILSGKQRWWIIPQTALFLLLCWFIPPQNEIYLYYIYAGVPFGVGIISYYYANELRALRNRTWESSKEKARQAAEQHAEKLGWIKLFISIPLGTLGGAWSHSLLYDHWATYKTYTSTDNWLYYGAMVGWIIVAIMLVYGVLYLFFYMLSDAHDEFRKWKENEKKKAKEKNKHQQKPAWLTFDNFLNFFQWATSMFMIIGAFWKPILIWFFIPITGLFYLGRYFVDRDDIKEYREHTYVLTNQPTQIWSNRFAAVLMIYSVFLAPIAFIWFALRRKSAWGKVVAWIVILVGLPLGYVVLDNYTKEVNLKQASFAQLAYEAHSRDYWNVVFKPHTKTVAFVGQKLGPVGDTIVQWKPFGWLPSGKKVMNKIAFWRSKKPQRRQAKPVKRQKVVARRQPVDRHTVRRPKTVERRVVPVRTPLTQRRATPPETRQVQRPTPPPRQQPKPTTHICKMIVFGGRGEQLDLNRGKKWTLADAKAHAKRYRTNLKKAFMINIIKGKTKKRLAVTPYFLYNIDGKPTTLFIPPTGKVVATPQEAGYKFHMATPVYQSWESQQKPCKQKK